MLFEIQLNDGSWIEASELPNDSHLYKKAILLDGTNEILTLESIMDHTYTYKWMALFY